MEATRGRAPDERLDRMWGWTRIAFGALVGTGALGALAGFEGAALAVVAGLAGQVAVEVSLALVKYRRTMRRPWPSVEPAADDDW